MADTAYRTHSAAMARLTRGDIRDFAARAVTGNVASKLLTTDSTILNTFVNMEQDAWRADFPGVKGFGQRTSDETWDITTTRHELPADFVDLNPSASGRIVLLGEDGNEDDQLEIITVGAYDQEWIDGQNIYTDRDDPVAYLLGVSTGDQRFLEIRPTPTTAIKFRLRYTSYVEILDADGDELEAPLGMHDGIQWGVAVRLAVHKGSPKVDQFRIERKLVWDRFHSPVTDERHRPGRVRSFEEVSVRGYAGFEFPE